MEMKISIFSVVFSFFFLITVTIPVTNSSELKIYQSTDNTGLGRQERFESIENYLTQMSKITKEMQAKLADGDGLEKQIKDINQQIENSKKEVAGFKKELSSLKTQWESYKTSNQGVSAAEWKEYQTFLKPLKEGEYAKLQQEVEALKLVIRSMEEVIKDQVKKVPTTQP